MKTGEEGDTSCNTSLTYILACGDLSLTSQRQAAHANVGHTATND